MALSVRIFLVLLGVVGALRVVELVISRRHQIALRQRGFREVRETHFRWMVLLHVTALAGAALEVVFLRRPFLPMLAACAGVIFLFANALRWWVIRVLGSHWNVQVMDSVSMGVVTRGPYRLVRHPNYLAVFLELASLPLIHTAWITSIIASGVHIWVLAKRLGVEEGVLLRNPDYRARMAKKPRFLPGLFALLLFGLAPLLQ